MKVEKYVYEMTHKNANGKDYNKKYRGQFIYKNTTYWCGDFNTIKEAQISVDVKRISLGLKPNLLKTKP